MRCIKGNLNLNWFERIQLGADQSNIRAAALDGTMHPSMTTITSCNVETIGESVVISLSHGDLLEDLRPQDVIVASVYKGSYTTDRYPNSFIAAIEKRFGICIEEEAQTPVFDLRVGLSTWVIQTAESQTILILEFDPDCDLKDVFGDLFFALQILIRKRRIVGPCRVLLPILGAGAQRRDVSTIAPALLEMASTHFAHLVGLSEIVIGDRDEGRIQEVKKFWDEYLGRTESVGLTTHLSQAVSAELIQLFEQFELLKHQKQGWIVELWKLLRTNQINSDTLPALCRQIVESIVADLWTRIRPQRNKKTLADDIEDLKNIGLAQWIVGYLHTLRQFGNYGSHYQGSSKTIPDTLTESDLILCLQCIRSILPVWRKWIQN